MQYERFHSPQIQLSDHPELALVWGRNGPGNLLVLYTCERKRLCACVRVCVRACAGACVCAKERERERERERESLVENKAKRPRIFFKTPIEQNSPTPHPTARCR